ncbi:MULTISPECIES: hypothetical protein [unclassified Oceanispirochaeta]|nr:MULTISPECIES: hypothetical protein [unclassified Oceanispirochaeta]MBF9017957.1 hypothetical protein [Oceanispirochaeta sp. M2]NPD74468.1 hypothetical protein [Oceanispirochaeta sp. M1]
MSKTASSIVAPESSAPDVEFLGVKENKNDGIDLTQTNTVILLLIIT